MFLEDPGIYYEVHGEGRPLVFLNGIMMNTLSWVEHIERLKGQYKMIVYDMRDQAQSAKLQEGYDISIHAEDLQKLLEHLKVERANLFGLSYGGQVAMIFALRYPELIDKLILANTSPYVDQYLLSIGQMWKRAARLYDGEAFFDLSLIPIYSRTFYNTNFDWLMNRRKLFKDYLSREWFDGFIRLASSNESFDVTDEIEKIKNETLLIAAEQDIIMPYTQMFEMSKKIENSQFVCIPDAGHAAFLEKIDATCTLIRGFLE